MSCLVLAEEVADFVLFSVSLADFVDVFVQVWGMVLVGAEVYEFDSILRRLVL